MTTPNKKPLKKLKLHVKKQRSKMNMEERTAVQPEDEEGGPRRPQPKRPKFGGAGGGGGAGLLSTYTLPTTSSSMIQVSASGTNQQQQSRKPSSSRPTRRQQQQPQQLPNATVMMPPTVAVNLQEVPAAPVPVAVLPGAGVVPQLQPQQQQPPLQQQQQPQQQQPMNPPPPPSQNQMPLQSPAPQQPAAPPMLPLQATPPMPQTPKREALPTPSQQQPREKMEGTVGLQEDSSEKARAVERLQAWLTRTIETGVDGLVKEYKATCNEAPMDRAPTFKENPTKNRYHNIPCCETTRVRIPLMPTYYIHGNYVSSSNSRNRFICTQSPLNATIEDFWRMIFYHSCSYIVMLCDLIEKGKSKSAEYFPMKLGDTITIGQFCTIQKEAQVDLDSNVTMSTMRLMRLEDGLQIVVKHIHWHMWPDFGVPDSFVTPFRVVSAVRSCRLPIVVHCAAGVGRTGTLVMIAIILENIKSPEFRGIQQLLMKLREERWKAVQTEKQYLYIHRCIIDYLLAKRAVQANPQAFAKFKEDYQQYMKVEQPPPPV